MTNEDYNDVMAENARLKAVQPVGQRATLFVIATLVVAMLTVIAIVALTIIRPERENTPVIAVIVGIVTPVLIGFVAAAVQQVHLAVNSRLSQLLELTAAESRARGALNERNRGDAVAIDLLAKTDAAGHAALDEVSKVTIVDQQDPVPVVTIKKP